MFIILKTVLGWANEKTHGGNDLRLYALDKGSNPRWDIDGGRTIERAIIENKPADRLEGNRFLVVELGDRFTDERKIDELSEHIAHWLNLNMPRR